MPVRCLLLLGIAPLALSQQPVEILPRIIVNVTGSNIPRTDIETALPIQRIGRDDIDRSGATTAAELLNTVSANLRGQNDATSNGGFFACPGLASANLRGLGSGSTLVLINGRRTANYAFDGGTVDLNSIPLAAVDRVEILKDGASAIYGADAMAGVINFIMRKDYAGIAVSGLLGGYAARRRQSSPSDADRRLWRSCDRPFQRIRHNRLAEGSRFGFDRTSVFAYGLRPRGRHQQAQSIHVSRPTF
jgi:iron complex outermembrane receptor protein